MAAAQKVTVAVFDVDETLIRCKSMFSFLEYALVAKMGAAEGRRAYLLVLDDLRRARIDLPREAVNRQFYRALSGWSLAELSELAVGWFDSYRDRDLYFPETCARLRWHQAQGHRTVLLSGSAHFIIAPIARDLAVDDVLAISLCQRADGTTDGEIEGIQTIGQGKADALSCYLAQFDHLSDVVGYGDHESDQPFLSICSEKYVVFILGEQIPDWASGFGQIEVRS